MEEQRNRKPAEPINRGWRIGRQQYIVLSLLLIPLVAIGTAYLFPAFARLKARKAQSLCLANLRMLYSGATAYAEDNDGRLPPQAHWYAALAPHSQPGCDFRCPATGKLYTINGHLGERRIPEVHQPTAVPLAWDAPLTQDGSVGPHNGGFNVVFLDGHVQWLDEATFGGLMTTGR